MTGPSAATPEIASAQPLPRAAAVLELLKQAGEAFARLPIEVPREESQAFARALDTARNVVLAIRLYPEMFPTPEGDPRT